MALSGKSIADKSENVVKQRLISITAKLLSARWIDKSNNFPWQKEF